MSNILLIVGVAVLAVALRTFEHGFFRKLGALCVLAVSYLIFYLPSGSHILGVVGVIAWFFLPWLEILTRIRRMRLPLDKKLRHRRPPSRDAFPHLIEFTDDVEDQGFEHVDDTGWEWDGIEQFIRIFYNTDHKAQASIWINEQRNISFAFMSVSSRTEDGRTWTTWNYPFAYPMKMAPGIVTNRVTDAETFGELLERHELFLLENKVRPDAVEVQEPEAIADHMQSDNRRQVDHNLDVGVIRLSGDGTFRYSWKGYFFLWLQLLKDMVRFS